jgi:hypothetical protein
MIPCERGRPARGPKRGVVLRISFFAALGLLAGCGVATLVGPSGAALWALPVGLAVACLSIILTGITRSRGANGLDGPAEEVVAAARANDRLGLARVDAREASDTEINGRALLELQLSVMPRRRAPFRTTARPLVPVRLAGRYAPGSHHVVVLFTPDGAELGFLDDDPSQPPWDRVRVPDAHELGDLVPTRRGVPQADGTLRRPWSVPPRAGAGLSGRCSAWWSLS